MSTDQQFLASFGVAIDESGVSRLQKILAENQTLAESLSSAFDAASESVKAFRESVSEDFPTLFSGSGYGNVTENLFGEYAGLKIGLNMTEPKKEIAAFTADAKKPISLSANASAIVSAARTAMESVRSLYSETFTLNVRAETNTDRKSDDTSSRQDSRNRDETGSAFLRMSTGGRFSRPTSVQVAEDGDAEYIIPVKKENKALPLLRQLLSELSPEARKNLTGENKEVSLQTETEGGKDGTEVDRISSVPTASQPVMKPEQLPVFDTPLPPVRESLSEDITPEVTVQIPTPELSLPASVSAPAAEKEPAAVPTAAIPDLHQVFAEADRPPAPAPATEKEPASAPAAVVPDLRQVLAEAYPPQDPVAMIPDLRQTFNEANRPLAPVPMVQKEALPSASDSSRQNLSDMISQLSSLLRPSGSSVTNTSNNVSAPVTINVNANGSDANRIGQSIYDTAERYLLRTLRSSVSS